MWLLEHKYEIFAFIAVLIFKSLSREVLFIQKTEQTKGTVC